jgi:predicted membrane chloride channel (bestrophin family)
MQVSATKERAEVELLKLHPDFVDIREDDDFHNWAEEQPKWVQQALYENDNDAKSAARAIDLYKADRNIGKKKSTSKDAAFATNTKTSRTKPQTNDESSYLKESQVQKMSSQEYEKRADEVMEAIRTGKFVYDVSGSAR